ncbi:MAG: hypothetical protein JXA78_15370 [Anaerolineales bacterium]|nr:hypothetical protein [Anaerolineales bacterium]
METAHNAARIWLVTGDRGAGKTTFCQQWVELARLGGWTTGGVLSLAEFEAGEKTAIHAEDLRTGERRLLASKKALECAGPRLGSWNFCAAALAWGDECLRQAAPCDLLVVDELGPLEFERGEGWQAGLSIVTQGEYALALVVVRPEYLETARQLWPSARVVQILA